MTMDTGANPFTSPELLDNPQPFLAMGRKMQPILFMDPPGIWHAFLYEDCRAILRDPKRFSSDFSGPAPNAAQRPASMLNRDPPRHTRLRELVNKAFTPRMVSQLEPRIRDITDELLDAAVPSGHIDLIEGLATPLPVIVIAEILGVPPADRAMFKRWSDDIAANLGAGLSMDAKEVPTTTVEELDE
jgi:cytochrome P450